MKKIKSFLIVPLLFVVLCGSIFLTACGGENNDGKKSSASKTYTLTLNKTGQGSTSGDGSFKVGTSVTVKATAANGYTFDGWYQSATKVSSLTAYTFTMPSNNLTLTAKFDQSIIATGVIIYYNNAVFNPDTHYFPIKEGAQVKLTAEVLPANATNKKLVWTVWEADSYVTVTQDGLITAVKSTMGIELFVSVYPEGIPSLASNIIVVVGGSNTVTKSNYSTYINLSMTGSSTSRTVSATFKSGYSGLVTLYLTFYATITYKEYFTNTVRTISGVTSYNDYFRPLMVGVSSISVGRYDFPDVNGTFVSINITGYSVIDASGTV